MAAVSALLLLLLLLPLPPPLLAGEQQQQQQQQEHHEYCIVGAGPAGLQLGHLMQEAGRDYVILDRAPAAGSFFEKFPRHGRLISVNKLLVDSANTEYSLRHDWNSLLTDSHGLKFRSYSGDMFPRRQDMLRYLRDFAQRLRLHIRYNTNVTDAYRASDSNRLQLASSTGLYACDIVIAATGLWQPRRLRLRGGEHSVSYADMSLDRRQFAGKRLLIIGKGNAAFETAAHLYGSARLTHLVSRSRLRLAWSSHYVGDVRAVNNEVLDTYQLKTVDALLEGDANSCELRRLPDGSLLLLQEEESEERRLLDSLPANASVEVDADYERFSFRYDAVVQAVGFQFDASWLRRLGVETIAEGKYPRLRPDYAASGVDNLYFAGTLAHALDYRRAAGGFVHGFRYTARALHRILAARRHRQPWPGRCRLPLRLLLDTLLMRINENSANYQMVATLADVLLIHRQDSQFTLLEEFPVQLLTQLPQVSGHKVTDDVIVSVFEYGRNFSGPASDVFHEGRATCDTSNGHECNFLHPVVYHYTSLPAADGQEHRSPSRLPRPARLLHLAEELRTQFRSRQQHAAPLASFLEATLRLPLAPVSLERCLLASVLAGDDVSSRLCQRWRSWSLAEATGTQLRE